MIGQRVTVAGLAGTVIGRHVLTINPQWLVRLDRGCVLIVAEREMEVTR